MGKIKWNDRKIAVLYELYPVETTAYTAEVVGMSETAVKNKAKELGIVKIAKPLWMKRAAHISSHFHTDSFSGAACPSGLLWSACGRLEEPELEAVLWSEPACFPA